MKWKVYPINSYVRGTRYTEGKRHHLEGPEQA